MDRRAAAGEGLLLGLGAEFLSRSSEVILCVTLRSLTFSCQGLCGGGGVLGFREALLAAAAIVEVVPEVGLEAGLKVLL